MGRPDVSVVIPCYNCAPWVSRAIDSVLAQQGVSVEVIVVDDGSTDDSLAVIRTYEDRIHWESGPNRGACAARNRGLGFANAEYVLFLDADDYLSPDFLRSALTLAESTGADLVFGPMIHSSQLPSGRMHIPTFSDAKAAARSLLMEKWLTPCTALFRASAVRRGGGWDVTLVCRQDVEFYIRFLARRPNVAVTTEGYAVYSDDNPDSISSKMSYENAVCTAHVLLRCHRLLRDLGFLDGEARAALELLARTALLQAARSGNSSAYSTLEALRREMGFPVPGESAFGRLAGVWLGVKNKERLSLLRRSIGGQAAR